MLGKLKVKSFSIIIFILLVIFPVTIFALNKDYTELSHRKDISSDKEWKITFKYLIDQKDINNDSIYILDEKDKKVDVKLAIDKGGKAVTVTPVQNYEEGKTYTLYISDSISNSTGEKTLKKPVKMNFTVSAFPVVGNYENFKKLMKNIDEKSNRYGFGRFEIKEEMAVEKKEDSAASNEKSSASKEKSDDYSKTNTQVEGVDEADIVKTDGEYIYSVNTRKQILSIVKAYPAEKMEIINSLSFYEDTFYPEEIYVDDKHLVVIGNQRGNSSYEGKERGIWYPDYYVNNTKAIIYDITDKKDIKKLREVELDGSYNTSRKIGSTLYLIANKYANYYRYIPYFTEEEKMVDKEEKQYEKDMLPYYKDSVLGEDFIRIDYSKIHYCPDSIEPNYMIIAAVDLNNNDKAADIFTSLGSSENVYVSDNNLYTTVSRYEYKKYKDSKNVEWYGGYYNRKTEIFKFSLKNGKVEYKANGIVPGDVLNQFSMDEHKGNFRIATTTGDMWAEGENISKNNLYVLNEEMNIVGKIEDIAPGEKIYSVRFVGDRAYMVTFRNVDPFFVLDLKNEKEPKILGALKIPGYSDYLHPYDENHIIGIGKDTFEIENKDREGKVIGTNAYYAGMKMALFDVKDVTNPIEKFKVKIGDRGTTSEVLYNHKALMFSKEKNIIAFPITVFEVNEDKILENDIYSKLQYGQFTFQGAYIYKIDEENGFNLKGEITHLNKEDYLKASGYGYVGDKYIKRIIYIGENLYTVSDALLKANNIESINEVKSIKLFDKKTVLKNP